MRRLLSDSAGATSIEYCLIATAVALALFIGFNRVGTQLKTALAPLTNGMNVHIEAKDTNIETDVDHTGSIGR